MGTKRFVHVDSSSGQIGAWRFSSPTPSGSTLRKRGRETGMLPLIGWLPKEVGFGSARSSEGRTRTNQRTGSWCPSLVIVNTGTASQSPHASWLKLMSTVGQNLSFWLFLHHPRLVFLSSSAPICFGACLSAPFFFLCRVFLFSFGVSAFPAPCCIF